MHALEEDWFLLSAWHSYVSCPTLYMFHHLCSPVSSNPSDGLQPPRFQPWTMNPPVGGSSAVVAYYPLLYMDPDFQHRSSPQCHIQQDDLYLCRFPSLLIAVLHVLPKIPNLVSSFHSDSAWNFKEQTSTGNSQAHHPLSLQSSIKSVYLRAFTFMWLHTIFFPWHVQLYCDQRLRLLGH